MGFGISCQFARNAKSYFLEKNEKSIADSADYKLMELFYLSKKIGFDISCKFSSKEIICTKQQNLFSEENEKVISNCLF